MEENVQKKSESLTTIKSSLFAKVLMVAVGSSIGATISFGGEYIDSLNDLKGYATLCGAVLSFACAIGFQIAAKKEKVKYTSTKYLVSSIILSSLAVIGVIEYLF